MAALHIVAASPYASRALEQCILRLEPGSAILLVGNGVYAGLKYGSHGDLVALAAKSCALYALAPDLAERGLGGRPLHDRIVPVDYPGFVGLAEAHNPVVTWL